MPTVTVTHTIPLEVLVRAAAALKAVKNSPIGGLPSETWSEVLHAHSALQYHLTMLMRDQAITVAKEPAHE
jgi:hypothetical protein